MTDALIILGGLIVALAIGGYVAIVLSFIQRTR